MNEVSILTQRELKRWYRRKYAIVFTLITPLFWIILFGRSFNIGAFLSLPEGLPVEVAATLREVLERGIMGLFGTFDYFTFMVCGMLSILVLFTSMWSGMSIVWDRRFGFLNKLLAAPISTSSIVMSRVLSSIVRGMVQVILIFSIAVALGLKLTPDFTILNLLGVFATLSLLSMGLSSIFTTLAFTIEDHETLIAMANMLNLPLMFASNALFPIQQMPQWLQIIAKVNPMTYCVRVVRGFVIGNLSQMDLLFSFTVLVSVSLLMAVLGIVLSHRVLKR